MSSKVVTGQRWPIYLKSGQQRHGKRVDDKVMESGIYEKTRLAQRARSITYP